MGKIITVKLSDGTVLRGEELREYFSEATKVKIANPSEVDRLLSTVDSVQAIDPSREFPYNRKELYSWPENTVKQMFIQWRFTLLALDRLSYFNCYADMLADIDPRLYISIGDSMREGDRESLFLFLNRIGISDTEGREETLEKILLRAKEPHDRALQHKTNLELLEVLKQQNRETLAVRRKELALISPTPGNTPAEVDACVVLPDAWNKGVVIPGNRAIVLEVLNYLQRDCQALVSGYRYSGPAKGHGSSKPLLSCTISILISEAVIYRPGGAQKQADLTAHLFSFPSAKLSRKAYNDAIGSKDNTGRASAIRNLIKATRQAVK